MTKTPTTHKETRFGVLEIHEIEKMVMDNLIQVQKFIFRQFDVLPINQETVKKIHQLLAGLCAWLIHRFLWIHPFFDYNGRVSRLIGELYLLQQHLPVTSFRAIARIDFVQAVKAATKNNNLSLLMTLLQKNS